MKLPKYGVELGNTVLENPWTTASSWTASLRHLGKQTDKQTKTPGTVSQSVTN